MNFLKVRNKTPTIGIFLRLVKYKLSLTVTFSALTGCFLTGKADAITVAVVFAGVLLLAFGSAALNQVQERETDLLMERTKNRPLPSSEISPLAALSISLILMFSGLLLLLLRGWIPTLLGLFTVILYNFIYTPLKRLSALSIIPGALVGAVCPLIGWASSNTTLFHPLALLLAIFVFLWQIPHFYLLLLQYSSDYKKAGFPGIFDLISIGRIKVLVFAWIVLTSAFLLLFPLFQNILKPAVISLLVLLNIAFTFLFYKLLFGKLSDKPFKYAFILINSFAVLIFFILILGRI